MSQNPFAPSASNFTPDSTAVPQNDELARRFTRFASAMVDGLLVVPLIIPTMFLTGHYQRMQAGEASVVEQLLFSLAGMLAFLAVHGYFVVTRGQSIGKILTKIQVVDANNGTLLPFMRVVVLRYWWMAPAVILVAIIPGQADNFIVNILSLVDAGLIFSAERRCLHDYIAGSKVVMYQPNRPRSN